MLKYDFGTFCRSSEKVLDEKGKIW
jgi:hypothetical protein